MIKGPVSKAASSIVIAAGSDEVWWVGVDEIVMVEMADVKGVERY